MAVVVPNINDLLAATKQNGTLIPNDATFQVVAGRDWREVITFDEDDGDIIDLTGSQYSAVCTAVTPVGSGGEVIRVTPTVTRGAGFMVLTLSGEATENLAAGKRQSRTLGVWLDLLYTETPGGDSIEIPVLAGHAHSMYLHPGPPA